MSTLVVPGAELRYETRGRGPLLVMIPGAFGAGAAFSAVAELLAAHYTVLTYDRRGFSRSCLTGPSENERRLEMDAEDVRRVIEHTGEGPAVVFGSSSGGIVALEVLARHPGVVRILVPFEPPLMQLVPDGEEWIGFFSRVYDVSHHSGMDLSLALFRERTFAPIDREVMRHARMRDPERGEDQRANAAYWFEHELRQYPAVALDFRALTASANRIVLAVGRESAGYPCSAATKELGKQLGRDVVELPGGHVGFLSDPAVFARVLHDALW